MLGNDLTIADLQLLATSRQSVRDPAAVVLGLYAGRADQLSSLGEGFLTAAAAAVVALAAALLALTGSTRLSDAQSGIVLGALGLTAVSLGVTGGVLSSMGFRVRRRVIDALRVVEAFMRMAGGAP